ncbi:MAG: trimethylamine methyltransferase family protein [Planctomycetota bacterium]
MSTSVQAPAAGERHLAASLYKPLTEAGLAKIADAALEVLEKSGMAVYSPTGFEALEKAGAMVDRETRTVRLPRALVEDAIDSNPSSITLFARDDAHHAVLEGNRVHYGTGGTALYVLDPDTGQRRPSTNADVRLNARLSQELDRVHVFTINVFPNEIDDREAIDVNRFFHALDCTTKHVMGGVYALQGCQDVVAMAQMMAGGAEALRAKPFVSFITLVISPFKIDEHYGEMTCYFAQQGLPVVVPTEPICGTTSPVTLAGNVLTHIAETLGGIALVQAVNKGAPGICGSVGSTCDLRTMDHLGGPVERGMINAAVAQLAQHFGIPLYSTAGTSDAKEVDLQAAYESAVTNTLVAMSGANYIHDALGLMEADLTIGYEKLVLDDEILGMADRVLQGIEVTDDTLAVDLLCEKGPGKDFLAEPHTVEHMRGEFFLPRLANRARREGWDPAESALARAKAFVAQVRASEPGPRIEAGVRSQILERFPQIVSEVDVA